MNVIGFFGRSNQPAQKERAFRAVVDVAYNCLRMQKVFIRDDEFHISGKDGKINGKALGYVFGFFDALLQSKGLDIRDEEGHAAVLGLLAKLFPSEASKTGTFLMHLKKMENDEAILNGVMLGGTQATDFLRTGKPVVRWVTCFSKELEKMTEERDRQRGLKPDSA